MPSSEISIEIISFEVSTFVKYLFSRAFIMTVFDWLENLMAFPIKFSSTYCTL
jgi:hypothetical protein